LILFWKEWTKKIEKSDSTTRLNEASKTVTNLMLQLQQEEMNKPKQTLDKKRSDKQLDTNQSKQSASQSTFKPDLSQYTPERVSKQSPTEQTNTLKNALEDSIKAIKIKLNQLASDINLVKTASDLPAASGNILKDVYKLLQSYEGTIPDKFPAKITEDRTLPKQVQNYRGELQDFSNEISAKLNYILYATSTLNEPAQKYSKVVRDVYERLNRGETIKKIKCIVIPVKK